MSGDNQRITLSIPRFSPEAKKLASDIAASLFTFNIHGKNENYLPSEVTDEMIRNEANRIASIQDPAVRANEIFLCICGAVLMIKNCQKVAGEVAQASDEMEELFRVLSRMKSWQRD
ncbi:MAG: hypothetical protein U0798_15250 [Gemmataceae bacterium]